MNMSKKFLQKLGPICEIVRNVRVTLEFADFCSDLQTLTWFRCSDWFVTKIYFPICCSGLPRGPDVSAFLAGSNGHLATIRGLESELLNQSTR